MIAAAFRVRDLFKPNTPYDGEKLSDGRIVFVELVPKEAPAARLVRRGGRTYLVSEKRLTNEDVAAALAQFSMKDPTPSDTPCFKKPQDR